MPEQRRHFSQHYRADIDGLRAVAILAVLVFHAFPQALPKGFVGVDVFFVISGYLISGIILRGFETGRFSFAEFYRRRFLRLMPALILMLSACYAVGWFALLPDEFRQLGKHIASGLAFVQNFVVLREIGYFDTGSELKPMLHLWSLGIEEQYYLLYPVLLWGAWRLRLNMTAAIATLLCISFALNVHFVGIRASEAFFLPHTRFWELLAGGLLASWPALRCRTPASVRASSLEHLFSLCGAALIALSAFGSREGKVFPGWWALEPVTGACLLILAGPNAGFNRWFLANRLMILIGVISYPLYLWHWPLLSFARIVEFGTPSVSICAGTLAISFVLAGLTYRYFELPIRSGEGGTRKKVAALCGLAVAVGAIGYQTYEREGLAFRHRKLAAELEPFQWGSRFENAFCRQAYPYFKGAFCSLEKPGNPTAILIGDSHSMALYSGLVAMDRGSEANLLNLASSGCLPFFDVEASVDGAPGNCREVSNAALAVAEQASVKTVIMTNRALLYRNGWRFTLSDGPANLDFAGVYRKALQRTLTRLLARKKRIVFVLDVPELGFDPRACANTRPLRLTHHLRTPCAVPRQTVDRDFFEFRQIARSVLKQFPAVQVIDGAAALCDNLYCWAMKNGKPLYQGSDHLSTEGARLVAARIAPALLGTTERRSARLRIDSNGTGSATAAEPVQRP